MWYNDLEVEIMDIIGIIEKKKLGQELTKEEIQYWIDGVVSEEIKDYQTTALLMAIRLCGMTEKETFALTEAMMNSGELMNLNKIPGVKCDKHSTGGVGDKTSLARCPMIAALGVKVAKMSGRGLGFTGGTLDKLEAIPGMRIEINPHEFIDLVTKNGIAIIGQSKSIDPADKKLYALRDVTATVDSMPLIASSIMSKKLASGCDCILLDVKYGSGAFMHRKEDAEELAKLMVKIGNNFNRDVRAEITSMNQPLGLAIGNSLEVKEAIDTLNGKGPKDFVDLCLSSGATMLLQAKIFDDREKAVAALKQTITSGSALRYLKNFIKAQGGDVSYIENPAKFPTAMYKIPVKSLKSGYVSGIKTMELGLLSMKLGAGRETAEDLIDPSAGIILNKKIGDQVNKGDLLLTMYSERPNMQNLVSDVLNYFDLSDHPVPVPPVVEERISYNKKTKQFIYEKEN